MLDLGAMITVVKEAASAAKAAGKIDLYVKIVDLQGKINELQTDLNAKEEEIQALRGRNAQLTKTLEFPGNLAYNGVWYIAAGDPHPYCPHCWEVSRTAIHLKHVGMVIAGERNDCPNCRQTFVDTAREQKGPPRLVPRVGPYSRRI